MNEECAYHGTVEPIKGLVCPECIGLLQEIARAVHQEIEFVYSHPHAAERGAVWVAPGKASKLYAAIKKLQEVEKIVKKMGLEAN